MKKQVVPRYSSVDPAKDFRSSPRGHHPCQEYDTRLGRASHRSLGRKCAVTSSWWRARSCAVGTARRFAKAERIPPNTVVPFTVDLHQQAYTFRAGHRIMVQVQSSWFPLYDRNPQTFVPNIFLAKAGDYKAQTHTVQRTARQASHVEVMVLK